MKDSPENPYASPQQTAGGPPTPTTAASGIGHPLWSRLLFALAAVPVLAIAFGAYMVWAVADFYASGGTTGSMQVFLGTSVLLLLISAYLIFFAMIGHRIVPSWIHIMTVILALAVAIPAGYFVFFTLF